MMSQSVEIKKLPVNTILSEIATYYKDSTLFVYRNKPFYKTRSEFYDVYKIKVDKGEVFSKFQVLNNTLNTKYNEGPVSFDETNHLVYVTRNRYNVKEMVEGGFSENPLEIDIYKEHKDIFTFTEKFKYNNKDYSVGHACFSPLTKRLYFSAKGKKTIGGTDLFFCTVKDNGDFGPVVSLGEKINTREDELFVSVNKGVMFFSTKGLSKRGPKNLDIYYIKEIDLLKNKRPESLGEPFNSKQDDFGIVFIDGQQGYLTSNRDNRQNYNHDIYYFNLGKPIEGDKEFDLLLTIDDPKKLKRLSSSNFKIIDTLTKKSLIKKITEEGIIVERPNENTAYKIVFNESLSFIDVEITPFTRKNNQILIIDSLNIKEKTIVIKNDTTKLLSSVDEMKEWFKENELNNYSLASFALNNIYFDYDKASISKLSSEVLNTLAEYLQINKVIKLKIFAHSDSRGNADYNLKLSDKRAQSVYKYLVEKGISNERFLEIKGLGESQLLETCEVCTQGQHERNRRVEFSIEK
jgi:outer membrane protein OmpA-like peptidoglycan-associated protein